MYFYLLHQCDIRRWINPFELETRDLELMLGITRKYIMSARNNLKQRGLIDFIKGRGSGKSIYLICGAEVTDEKLCEKFCVSIGNAIGNAIGNTIGNTNGNTNVKIERHSSYINNIYNSSIVESSVASATRGAPQRASKKVEKSLFAEEEKKAANRKSPPRAKPSFTPPTLDEVKEYFLSHDADKRLENWEECAQRFYDYFNAVDWIDKNGRRITRWDSRANSWIIDDEKREKENIAKNEIKQQDRFSERRGTEPTAKSRKGFKGTF